MAHYKGAASEAGRAMQLQKKREKAMEELEHKKRKIEEELKVSTIGSKFSIHYDAIEQQLRTSTVGLVTLDQMRAKQEVAVKERERQLALKTESIAAKEAEDKQRQKDKQKQQIQTLSFRFDDDEEEEEDEDNDKDGEDTTKSVTSDGDDKRVDETSNSGDNSNADKPIGDTNSGSDTKDSAHESGDESSSEPLVSHSEEVQKKAPELPKKTRMIKNPDVDTSFLRDRDREDEENLLREQLRQEWVNKQEQLKGEDIEITFSYWDGSGHRRAVVMKKGHSVYQFLQKCLDTLRKEFHELRTVTADQLMYIKEDLIIPQHYTFYDFIVTKARGKSGPLFAFDVHDDVRLTMDVTVERDESHAGKVLLRSWYERNKHIFPASRWEPYDPTKSYEKYTISDRNK
ncbi:unnamed protein product [Medioppia subpectinata]|uniref:Protein FAM50 homolog n=1 Tax=Medioppia subpectinata TaxID=1979941 RepID=A0A7R9PY98_9ACAR|nr:unnamed protein product [Medioppia subpectinata]CAG2105859.1 unnamed protein product [Medioppia subpectinata]